MRILSYLSATMWKKSKLVYFALKGRSRINESLWKQILAQQKEKFSNNYNSSVTKKKKKTISLHCEIPVTGNSQAMAGCVSVMNSEGSQH